MPLTDVQVKNLKASDRMYKLFDGDGLFIEVTPAGSKIWKMKYYFKKLVDGVDKRVARKLNFGTYPEVSLKDAREKRFAAKKLIANGIDPAEEEKRIVEEQHKTEETNARTFNVVGKEWWEEWKKDKSHNTRKNKARVIKPFRNAFGKKQITTITPREIKEVMQILTNDGKVESAKRGLWGVKAIFNYAMAMGDCIFNPAEHLAGFIPKQSVKHHVAITDPEQLGEMLRKIDQCNSAPSVKYCLRILAYLPLRSTEIREATWGEIDFEDKSWTIPATRRKNEKDGGGMKNRQPHRVPLSRQVAELFQQLRIHTGDSEYCFPNAHGNKCITDNALLVALKRLGYRGMMTAHGFRTTFSTICNENKKEWGFDKDEIEYQLAHSETDQVRAAYCQAKYFDGRRALMQKWADYLDELKASN